MINNPGLHALLKLLTFGHASTNLHNYLRLNVDIIGLDMEHERLVDVLTIMKHESSLKYLGDVIKNDTYVDNLLGLTAQSVYQTGIKN